MSSSNGPKTSKVVTVADYKAQFRSQQSEESVPSDIDSCDVCVGGKRLPKDRFGWAFGWVKSK